VTVNEDPEEMERRLEFSRYAYRFLITPVLVNGLRSALENIEKRSQELLAEGTTARFLDKRADSGEVVKLVERLREALANYQVSENCFVASGMAHYRTDIATTSDLRPYHRPHCERFPLSLYPLH